ncbi:MAG: peptidase M23 [Acidobacteria bacterium]|nr:MAG: peptidase M23 [Acidobacteriota bacterium]
MSKNHLIALFWILLLPAILSAQGLDTTKIDEVLGRPGQKSGDVYRVGFPRTDLHVKVGDVEVRPGLALGSWAAFSGNDEHAMVMGDLVLLEKEVNPVMLKLRAANFDITAVHNHVLDETPQILYMHYLGHGPVVELAKSLRAALSVSQTPLGKPAPAQPSEPAAFVKTVEATLGAKGTWNGGVLGFGIPRAEPITEDGITLTTPQGVAEAINFQEAGPGKIATTGDFVLIASEVNPVISALEAHDIQVTALHMHMLTENPRLFFMHFWSVGSPDVVAQGIKAALEKIHTK